MFAHFIKSPFLNWNADWFIPVGWLLRYFFDYSGNLISSSNIRGSCEWEILYVVSWILYLYNVVFEYMFKFEYNWVYLSYDIMCKKNLFEMLLAKAWPQRLSHYVDKALFEKDHMSIYIWYIWNQKMQKLRYILIKK